MNIPKRVLLLGEYSGFHRNLKEGLLEHGVECIIASTSDGFKRIPGDIALYNTDNKKVSEKVYNHIIKPLKKNKDLYGQRTRALYAL